MNLGEVETYQAGGLWHNHVVGHNTVLSSHETKEEARLPGKSTPLSGALSTSSAISADASRPWTTTDESL